MNKIQQQADALARPIIEEIGYELIETTFKKEYGEDNLTFYIYKKGGITLEDCERVTAALDTALEENDITNGSAYNLNVSSPGLDRLIVSDDDFRRNLDTDIELIFLKPMGKKKKTHGLLLSHDQDKIVILEKGRQTSYKKTDCQTVRPYINFK